MSLFLGIRRSMCELSWQDRLDQAGANRAGAISQRFDLPELLGRVLAARGATLETVESHLNPSLKNLMPDPSLLRDMDKGARRIAEAIMRAEKVAVFGDYDVDGGVSCALLKKLFKAHGQEADLYIPDRLTEGYGPNQKALEILIEKGARLIITVDCGTTAHEALAKAPDYRQKQNVDIVIIDHHQAGDILPDVTAVINPNRQDDLSGQGHLAAAGLVFLTLVAVVRILREESWYSDERSPPDLFQWLDLVALATVCDVVPLQGLNRAYVTQGLKIMHRRQNIGLTALCDRAALDTPPNSYHLGYVLGPRINAGGRIGEAGLGARLLSSDDLLESEQIAEQLEALNHQRKAMEAEMIEAALASIELALKEDPDMPVLICGSRDWHKGLVGLAASRLTDRYRRPSLVLSWDAQGVGSGSARSIEGVDIGAAIAAAANAGLLIRGGGHAMAAGLSVDQAHFQALKDFFNEKLAEECIEARKEFVLKVDGALLPNSVNPDLMDLLDKAGPYGAGNPTPRFVFPAHRVVFAKIVGEAHIRCSLRASDQSRINAIAFRAVGSKLGDQLLRSDGQTLHIAGQLRRNHWRGRTSIELLIDDVAHPSNGSI